MRLILYIGHHKVGSTALQAFLAQNTVSLLKRGILYPAVESMGFSHFLAKMARAEDVPEFEHVNIREPHSALAYRMIADEAHRPIPPQFRKLPGTPQMLAALKNQVKRLEPHTVILASEAFSNFGDAAPNQIDRLLNAFPQADVQIYCALRRPDEYLISWHGQRIKVGEPVRPLRKAGITPYENNIHFNFDRVPLPWIDRLPGAKLSLRSYSDILSVGGSIEDFAFETGLNLLDGTLPVERHNKSLALATVEIARRANHDLPVEDARRLRDYLLWETGDLGLLPNRDIEMLGEEKRSTIAERFSPIHQTLATLVNKGTFFQDFNAIHDIKPIPEIDAVADTLSKIDPTAFENTTIENFLGTLKHDYGI